jgi:hypothetical protein
MKYAVKFFVSSDMRIAEGKTAVVAPKDHATLITPEAANTDKKAPMTPRVASYRTEMGRGLRSSIPRQRRPITRLAADGTNWFIVGHQAVRPYI